jgi:YesN/AraC family two-component response regulator
MEGNMIKRTLTKGPNILIIDDDPLIRDVYGTILKDAGYNRVTTAKNGAEGLKQVAKQSPDLVLLDIIMPEVDGMMFLKQYNPDNHPETKIIVLSNSATSDNITTAFRLGVTHYLVKTDLKPRDVKRVVLEILEEDLNQ